MEHGTTMITGRVVDDLEVHSDGDERTVELTIRLDSDKETVR